MQILPQIEPKTQNSYQSQRIPGDKLPPRQPDAWQALRRNADAFALDEAARPNKDLHFNRKADAPPAIIRVGGLEAP